MPVLVQPLDESLSQESPFWTVADEWDTMYLLWNWTDKAEDVVVTFYWSDGSGHFKLPVHLEAQGSATIDMAKVVAGGQPDAEGNVIPTRVRQGSAIFASPKGVTSPIKLAIWGAHFSARLGVAEACCLPCNGYSEVAISLSLSYNPISSFGSVVGQSTQLYFLALFSDGSVHDFTGSATWSSSDTAVATVAGGLVTGAAGGSSQITASRSLVADGEKALGCGGCPGQQLMTAGAGGNVKTVGYVSMYSNTASTQTCTDSLGHTRTMPSRVVYYQVMDTSSPPAPIKAAGISVAETISFSSSSPCKPSDGCGQKPTAGSWTTDSSGIINQPGDVVVNCSATCVEGGECAEVWEQTFTVEGKSVQIINGTTTGARNCWSADCKNGPSGNTSK
jgi:hypothetical protein